MLDVMVLIRDAQRWGAGAEYAASLVARCGGSLTAIHAIEPPSIPEVNSTVLAAELTEMYLARTGAALNAEAPFRRWAAERGVARSAWRTVTGPGLPALQAAGQWQDLLVVDRELGDDTATEVGPLLLRTGLPCIVVGETNRSTPPRTIAVAWNGTLEAARALHASLPLLRTAERVVLLRGTPCAGTWTPMSDIGAYLDWQGLKADSIPIDAAPDAAGAALLGAAAQESADLMVMGAYGRTRFSEWFLGGVTRHALEHADLPVFLRH